MDRQSICNPFESTFGTIRHRTRRCKGELTRDGVDYEALKEEA